jgi:hypothetical protein
MRTGTFFFPLLSALSFFFLPLGYWIDFIFCLALLRAVYGVPIEDLYWRDGDSFPLLVDVLVDLIEQKGSVSFSSWEAYHQTTMRAHSYLLLFWVCGWMGRTGLDQQGIYRVPGEKRVIENLQASIDERGN